MGETLVYQLSVEMKRRNVKTPKLAKTLSIPKDRIYKWFQEGTNPKEEDAVKIRKWLSGELEKVPRETNDYKLEDGGEFYTPSGKMNMGDRAMIIALKEIVAKLMVGNPKFSDSLQGCLNEIDEHTILVLNRLLNMPS